MKALLIKDFYTLFKQVRFYLLFIIIFSIIPGEAFSCISFVYAALLPITALAYDERSKWESLAIMMPYTKMQLVLSKYALGFIGVGCCFVVTVLAKIIVAAITEATFGLNGLLLIIIFACVAVSLLALNLPVMFRFGVEKGRIAYLVVVAVISALVVGLSSQIDKFTPTNNVVYIVSACAVSTAIIINVVSIFISAKIFKSKRI